MVDGNDLIPGSMYVFVARNVNLKDPNAYNLFLYLGMDMDVYKFNPLTWYFYSIKLGKMISIVDNRDLHRFVNVEP